MSVSCKWGDGRELHVGLLPGRKSIALYTILGCCVEVLAWFPSETQAAEFCRILWNVTYPDALPYSESVSVAGIEP